MKLNISKKAPFTKKLRQLPMPQQEKVQNHIQKLAASFENGKIFFGKNAYQPYQFILKDNLNSSLFASKVSPDLHLIFSIDEDPLFGKLEVTLYDLTNNSKEQDQFKKIGETIYRSENLLS